MPVPRPPVAPHPGRARVAVVGQAIVDAIVGPDHIHPTPHELRAMREAGDLPRRMADRYDRVATWVPGGSGANTAAELGRHGVPTAFVGVVGDDAPGRPVARGFADAGVRAALGPDGSGRSTSRVYVMVDEEGERSFVQAVDACDGLSPAHVAALRADAPGIVHVESYLLDRAPTVAAFHAALDLAASASALASVTLGTPRVAAAHAETVLGLARTGRVGLLVGNEEEFAALLGAPRGDVPVAAMASLGCACVITRGPDGALATVGGGVVAVPSPRVTQVVDTTGAGDAFAAGLLEVLAAGGTMRDALGRAVLLGAEAVTRRGARAVPVPATA